MLSDLLKWKDGLELNGDNCAFPLKIYVSFQSMKIGRSDFYMVVSLPLSTVLPVSTRLVGEREFEPNIFIPK